MILVLMFLLPGKIARSFIKLFFFYLAFDTSLDNLCEEFITNLESFQDRSVMDCLLYTLLSCSLYFFNWKLSIDI